MLETARYHEGKLKMQTKENAKDLIAMGYRLLGVNKNGVTIYAKPFGYGLFTVSFEEGVPVFRQLPFWSGLSTPKHGTHAAVWKLVLAVLLSF